MKIGIDCRTISRGKTGIGYYTYFLVKNLLKQYPDHEFVLFFDSREEAENFSSQVPGGQGNFKIVTLPFSNFKKFLPFLYSHVITPLTFSLEKLDLLHGPANSLPFFYFGKSVVTVHDLAIYEHPEWFPGGQFFSTRVLVPWSLRKASEVIAVSETTKNDLIRLLKVPAEKITVVYEGVDLENFKPASNIDQVRLEVSERFRIEKKLILFLGTLEPRKNITRLIEAFQTLPNRDQYQLVVAGGKGWNFRPPPADKDIIYTGYISDQEKIQLMQTAEVFAFPSLYEGFGLPVLEAMACGTLVVTSNNSSLQEIGRPVAILVTALQKEEIRDGLSAALSSEPDRAALRQHAEKFSWYLTAEQTMGVYLKYESRIR